MRYTIAAIAVVILICAAAHRCRQARQPDDGSRIFFDLRTGERSEGKAPDLDARLRAVRRKMAATTEEN